MSIRLRKLPVLGGYGHDYSPSLGDAMQSTPLRGKECMGHILEDLARYFNDELVIDLLTGHP